MIFLYLVFMFLFFGIFCLRSVYFSSVSCVKIVSTDSTYIDYYVVPIKPSKKFFKSLASGSPSSFVNLGNGYFAFYVSNSDDTTLIYNDFEFTSDVYIFNVSRLGRYKSIDLSDRCLNDIIKKFKGV